jgi:hypothetical protein
MLAIFHIPRIASEIILPISSTSSNVQKIKYGGDPVSRNQYCQADSGEGTPSMIVMGQFDTGIV